MTFRAAQQINLAGVASANWSASSGAGDTFTPGDRTFLFVINLNAASTVVTVVTPRTSIAGTAIDDLTMTVPASEIRFMGPFPAEHFADPTTGLATVTWSVTSSVVFAIFTI